MRYYRYKILQMRLGSMWGCSKMDVSQYLEIFIDETKEHLQNLSDQLMILEREPDNTDTINEIFRAAHSLKGMAGTMGYKKMQRLTHDMENVFSEIRNGTIKVQPAMVDVLFRGLDALEGYLDVIINSGDEGDEENDDIINDLNSFLNGGSGDQAAAATKKEEKTKKKETASTASDDDSVFKNMQVADFEQHAIQKAKDEGQNIYGIRVVIDENCILKAARAFLVFKALEDIGDVIKSIPDVQDIEDEKFEQDFTVLIITKEDIEAVKSTVLSISEISKAIVEVFDLDLTVEQNIEKSDAATTTQTATARVVQQQRLHQLKRQRQTKRKQEESLLSIVLSV